MPHGNGDVLSAFKGKIRSFFEKQKAIDDKCRKECRRQSENARGPNRFGQYQGISSWGEDDQQWRKETLASLDKEARSLGLTQTEKARVYDGVLAELEKKQSTEAVQEE
jgi:hypothetical protein